MASAVAGEVYRHFKKGGRYTLIFVVSTHERNGDRDVIYVSLQDGEENSRPLMRDSRACSVNCAWLDRVKWPDGIERERFVSEKALSKAELAVLQPYWDAAERHTA